MFGVEYACPESQLQQYGPGVLGRCREFAFFLNYILTAIYSEINSHSNNIAIIYYRHSFLLGSFC
jgi:hypothetical protein